MNPFLLEDSDEIINSVAHLLREEGIKVAVQLCLDPGAVPLYFALICDVAPNRFPFQCCGNIDDDMFTLWFCKTLKEWNSRTYYKMFSLSDPKVFKQIKEAMINQGNQIFPYAELVGV